MITRNCCRQNCHTVGKNNWKVFTSSKIDTTVELAFVGRDATTWKYIRTIFNVSSEGLSLETLKFFLYIFRQLHPYSNIFSAVRNGCRLCISYLCLFWKYSMYVIASPLTHIINLSISSGIFLILWKLPVSYNKSGDHRLFQNYSQCYLFFLSYWKLRVVYKRILDPFLISHVYFFNNQYGFRKNNLTSLALMHLCEKITSAIDRWYDWNLPSSF